MGLNYDGGLTCSINVTDLDRSISFYQELLGMTLLYRVDEIGWCELQSPVGKVNVGLSEGQGSPGAGGATLTFGVTNIDAAKAYLDGQGVRIDGDIITIPDLVKLLTFYDPDDNALMVYQQLGGEG